MEKLSKHANDGKKAELLDLDRKKVDKAMKELQAEGTIVFPVSFKWDMAHKNHGFLKSVMLKCSLSFNI